MVIQYNIYKSAAGRVDSLPFLSMGSLVVRRFNDLIQLSGYLHNSQLVNNSQHWALFNERKIIPR